MQHKLLEEILICFMLERKENSTKQIESILFIVMLFFVFAFFSGRSEKMTFNDAHYVIVTGLHSNSVPAIISDNIQTPVLQKSLLTSMDKTGLLFYNDKFKIAFDNRSFAQRFFYLEKSFSFLEPQSTCRFYYHLFSMDAKDLPSLS